MGQVPRFRRLVSRHKKREPLAALLINQEGKWQHNDNRLWIPKEAMIGHVGVILRRAAALSRAEILRKGDKILSNMLTNYSWDVNLLRVYLSI
jgi:hypothetical protein